MFNAVDEEVVAEMLYVCVIIIHFPTFTLSIRAQFPKCFLGSYYGSQGSQEKFIWGS